MTPDISKVDTDRHLNLGCLRGTSAMTCCDEFFMGIVSLRSEDLLIPFLRTRFLFLSPQAHSELAI